MASFPNLVTFPQLPETGVGTVRCAVRVAGGGAAGDEPATVRSPACSVPGLPTGLRTYRKSREKQRAGQWRDFRPHFAKSRQNIE